MKRILVADDEPRMLKLVSDFLEKEGYEVIRAFDGKQAIELFEYNKESLDLVILDVMMPEYDGWSVCRKVKELSQLPVIMLTARSEESDELFGFELGADEYIKKPFSPKILVARVNAMLKRSALLNNHLSFDELQIDETARKVTVNNEVIDLAPKEYELLIFLVRNKGMALSRDKIIENVWEYDYIGDERTLDTHIKKLRKKLGPASRFIATVWGFGYRFEVTS